MAHANTPETNDDDPWGGVVDANHLFGDYYWVDKYRPLWWLTAGALCFVLPPLGVALMAYMAGVCVTPADADIDLNG